MSPNPGDWQPIDINVRQVIKDFLDAYPSEPEEVMVVESIANSLDADAKNVKISLWRNENGTYYSISDDGDGMTEDAFKHSYHALALSTKDKGSSTIGFAGVGGKLYLAMLEAGDSIYTETKSNAFTGASELALIGNYAKWKAVPSKRKLKSATGTYVELKLRGSNNLDMPTVEKIIQDNYNSILLGLYGKKSISVSWKSGPLPPWKPTTESEDEFNFKVNGIKCAAYFWLSKSEFDHERGFDIVVLGKRIRTREWFDVEFKIRPEFSRRVCGMVASDVLSTLLTTNKQDLKIGNQKTWLSYKKEVDKALMSWLESIGAAREAPKPRAQELAAASEVSDLINKMLKMPDLSIYNPFLKKTIGSAAIKSDNPDSFVKEVEGDQPVTGNHHGKGEGDGVPTEGGGGGKGIVSSDDGTEMGERVTRRLRSGIAINIDTQEKNPLESWVTPEAIVVNKGHPVYKKFLSQGYTTETNNIFRCAVMALIENADPAKKLVFDELRKFYNSWAGLP